MTTQKMNMNDMAEEFDAKALKIRMAQKYGMEIANMGGTLLATSLLQREVREKMGPLFATKLKLIHVSMVGELGEAHAQKLDISPDEFMKRAIQCAEEIEAAAENFTRAAVASGKMAEDVVAGMQNKAG